MPTIGRTACVLVALVPTLCTSVAPAEEALLRDGRSIQGKLSQSGGGALSFVAEAKSVPLVEIDRIRFTAKATPFYAAAVHQILLKNEQRVTGVMETLDSDTLRVRTAWQERLAVPRAAIVCISHLADLVTVLEDDFETDLKGWKLTGSPSLSDRQHVSGQKSLCLTSPGQAAELSLRQPLTSGQLNIHFCDADTTAGLSCWLEAEFLPARKEETPRLVKVVLAGDGARYAVETALPTEEAGDMRRTPGWHRLSLRFHESYLLAGIDDVVLFSSKQGPGALTKLRLRCSRPARDADTRGQFFFDDLSLARRVPHAVHPKGDATQDELWLVDGDQLFGAVVRADRRSIEVRGRFGQRTFSWGDVRGIYLKEAALPSPKAVAAHIRVLIHSGCGEQLDELEGSLVALTDEHLTLHHPQLGNLDIARGRIRQIRPLR